VKENGKETAAGNADAVGNAEHFLARMPPLLRRQTAAPLHLAKVAWRGNPKPREAQRTGGQEGGGPR